MFTTPTKLTKCIALGLAISVTACQTNLVHEAMPNNSVFSNGRTEEIAKSYSGEELFRGIFMAEGEVANKISIFDKMPMRQQLQTNDSLKIKYKTELDKIVAAIKIEQPNFFTDFEKEITSGNVLKVQNELNYASKTLIETLMKQPKYEKGFAKADKVASKIDIAEVSTADGKVDMNKLEEIINKQKLEDSFNPHCAVAVFELAIYVMVVVDLGIVWSAALFVNIVAMVNFHAGTNATVDYGDFYNANGSGGGGVYTNTGVSRRTTKAQQPLNTSTIHGLQQEMFIAELTTTFKK